VAVARDAVRLETLDLADCLSALSDDQWDSMSLCTAWRIRDVVAHLTAGADGAFGPRAIAAGLLRHRFDYNRWIAADGRRRGQQAPAILLQAFRRTAADTRASSADQLVRALTHVVVHGQDIRRPLGVKHIPREPHLVAVADFVATSFIFRASRRIGGLKLIATDLKWSRGSGPEVHGPAEALVMVMAGRLAALEDLSGDGLVKLRRAANRISGCGV
jgi:uncharacterized protein (TIGR03083 family)